MFALRILCTISKKHSKSDKYQSVKNGSNSLDTKVAKLELDPCFVDY